MTTQQQYTYTGLEASVSMKLYFIYLYDKLMFENLLVNRELDVLHNSFFQVQLLIIKCRMHVKNKQTLLLNTGSYFDSHCIFSMKLFMINPLRPSVILRPQGMLS